LNNLLIGRRFICPNWQLDDSHIGLVIRDEKNGKPNMRRWLHFQQCLVGYSNKYAVGAIINWMTGRPSAGAALALWAIVLLAMLWLAPWLASHPCWRLLARVIVVYYIFDSLAYNTSVAFVTQQPRLPLRSALFGGIAFFELSLAFAVLYLCLPAGTMTPPLDRLTAPYFSLVTIVTLGYGDISPSHCSILALVLVMAEILIGLYFLSILFAIMVGWANQSSTLPTLCEIIAESEQLDKNMSYSTELTEH